MKKYPFYLILLAAYPSISLYALNITEIGLAEVVRPLIVSLLVMAGLVGLLWLFFRKYLMVVICSSLVFLIISSYGALYNIARHWQIGTFLIGRHRFLLPFLLILLAIALWKISGARTSTLQEVTRGLNAFSVVLIAFPVFSLIIHANQVRLPQGSDTLPAAVSSSTEGTSPDVYYFILDSYGRADFIEEYMRYDNSPFLNGLTSRGFTVLDCSLANYSYTRLSLASSLNLEYLENLGPQFVPEEMDESLLDPLIQKNRVMQTFRDQGYKTVALVTGYQFTEMSDADYYFKPLEKLLMKPVMTEFEYMVIKNTLFSLVSSNETFVKKFGLDFPYYQKWNTQHFIIDTVRQIPAIPGPKFVFVHLVTNHRPYIFRPDGSILNDLRYYKDDGVPVNDDYYIQGYQYGLDFTNAYMLELIDTIQASSPVPPVIIIQGDHGVRIPGRLSILNAISFPGHSDEFYNDMTPVNTFRIILRNLFGTAIENLPDKSYYADVNIKPYELTPADNQDACRIQ